LKDVNGRNIIDDVEDSTTLIEDISYVKSDGGVSLNGLVDGIDI